MYYIENHPRTIQQFSLVNYSDSAGYCLSPLLFREILHDSAMQKNAQWTCNVILKFSVHRPSGENSVWPPAPRPPRPKFDHPKMIFHGPNFRDIPGEFLSIPKLQKTRVVLAVPLHSAWWTRPFQLWNFFQDGSSRKELQEPPIFGEHRNNHGSLQFLP